MRLAQLKKYFNLFHLFICWSFSCGATLSVAVVIIVVVGVVFVVAVLGGMSGEEGHNVQFCQQQKKRYFVPGLDTVCLG